MQKISRIHKLIFEIQQILGSYELNGHVHFWPCPPKNHWNNFKLSWICTSMQNISSCHLFQFVIFKPLGYCFEETKWFDVMTSFASRPVSRLSRWYNKPGDITNEFWEKVIQFHGTFHGLKPVHDRTWDIKSVSHFEFRLQSISKLHGSHDDDLVKCLLFESRKHKTLESSRTPC